MIIGSSISIGNSLALASGIDDPSDLFGAGDDGFWLDFNDNTTLWQEVTRTTQADALNDPVAYADDKSGKGNDASQSTGASQPLMAGTTGIKLDTLDDVLEFTVPSGGWSGTFLMASADFIVHGEIAYPVGTQQLPLDGNRMPGSSGTDWRAFFFIDRVLTVSEITQLVDYLVANSGATDNAYSGSAQSWLQDWLLLTKVVVKTGSMTSLNSFVRNCQLLTDPGEENWDTSSLTNLSNTFFDCHVVPELDVSGFDTSGVTTCQSTFRDMLALTSLDISSWDLGMCTSFNSFSRGSTNLTTLTVGTVFQNSPATNYASAFISCALDIASVNAIIIDIEAAGLSNGTLNMTGGTSAAPTGAGATAVTTLQGRGWTVTTN